MSSKKNSKKGFENDISSSKKNSSSYYDVIIVGGGIGGLYTMYKLTQKNPELKILLLEKEKKLGGRISTYKDKYMTLEEGAGRFSDVHVLFIDLLNELGLNYKITKASGNAVFMPSGGHGKILKISDDVKKPNPSFLEALTDPIFNYGLDLLFDESTLPCTRLIAKVVLESKFDNKKILQNLTFLQYARRVLNKQQIEFIWDCFGYSNELCIMNAYDCISLMNTLSPLNNFYSLRGGLYGVIEKMVEVIQKNRNCTIMMGKDVHGIQSIDEREGFIIKLNDDGLDGLDGLDGKKSKGMISSYFSKKVVCALPKEALSKLRIFQPIQTKLLDKVNPGSLCRIYSRFEKDSTGKYWFHDLPKFTTNNPLRMVIPFGKDSDVVMISYSDGAFADSWWRLYKEKGCEDLDKKIKELIFESTGISIPRPKSTRVFYWKYGVGYWGLGADSETVANKIIRPFPEMDLFICGEMYSYQFQQWIEGALETSSQIVDTLC